MNTYDFQNIVAFPDNFGALCKLGFTLYATDPRGEWAEASWVKSYDVPLKAISSYSQEALVSLCHTIALENLIQAQLDKVLFNRTTLQGGVTPFVTVAPPIKELLSLTQAKTAWFQQIDNNIAATMLRVTRFQLDYDMREAAAKAYTASDYSCEPTTWITRYADNIGITYQACAKSILSQATILRSVLKRLGELRMDKYLVLKATTMAEAEAVFHEIMSQWAILDGGLK